VLKDNGFGNLGFNSVAINYFFFGTCALFVSPLVKRLGSKYSMFIGSLPYTLYIASFILAALRSQSFPEMSKTLVQITVMTTSALNGAGASLLWVA